MNSYRLNNYYLIKYLNFRDILTCTHCFAFLFSLILRESHGDNGTEESSEYNNSYLESAESTGSLESNESPSPGPQSILSLVISNVWGPNALDETAKKRKKAIAGMLKSIQPYIVLLQEFRWAGIRENTWLGVDIPNQYIYAGHKEASFLYDKDKLSFKLIHDIEVMNFLEEMAEKNLLPGGKPPRERMAMGEIKNKDNPTQHFLCISWHGYYKKKTYDNKIKDLKNLFISIQKIARQMNLPFVIAGDFNLSYAKVTREFQNSNGSMVAYEYMPLRRGAAKLFDFYIASRNLHLADIQAIDWKNVDNEKDISKIFDHDPVVANLMMHASLNPTQSVVISE